MGEHKICKGCQYNEYPRCGGSYIGGEKMRIDNLKPGFACGQKYKPVRYMDIIVIPNLMNRKENKKIEKIKKDLNELITLRYSDNKILETVGEWLAIMGEFNEKIGEFNERISKMENQINKKKTE